MSQAGGPAPTVRWSGLLAMALVALAGPAAGAGWLSAVRDNTLGLDPAVAGAQAQMRAAEERVVQARAGFGPTASVTADHNQTHYSETLSQRRFHGTVTTLQVTQPLLRNELYPALKSAQAQFEHARATLAQVRDESTVRLLEAVFDALKARDAVTLARAQRLAAEEQLASARRSFTVGNVSVIDVREAEAKIDTVDAQSIAAAADLALKQQLLTELAGRPLPELLDRSLDGDRMPDLPPASMLEWLADAQTRNPQLQAAWRTLEASEAELRKAWQGHAPSVNLTYTYTNNADTGTVTSIFPRQGQASTVGVSLNIPLFASGATQAKVRESMALRDKAQSDVDAARRTVQLGVRQNFSAALSSVSLAHGLETATRSLEVAFRANRRGYEVGMKVNAEVLDAQTKVFESRRNLSRARYDAWLSYVKLKSYAGMLGDADIDELDRLLVVSPSLQPQPSRARPPVSDEAPP